MAGVKTGDVFSALIEQEIKASPSVTTPIRAVITEGRLKGYLFIGEAILDKELKRVLLSFGKLRTRANEIYEVKASGLSTKGSIGLEGDYHQDTGKFFVAELAAATAAAMADSTINRSQNAFGNFVEEPGLGTAGKKGITAALSKTADRFADQVRTAPEYTEVSGFQNIQIIVQDEPRENE
jgi:hypothetical protein